MRGRVGSFCSKGRGEVRYASPRGWEASLIDWFFSGCRAFFSLVSHTFLTWKAMGLSVSPVLFSLRTISWYEPLPPSITPCSLNVASPTMELCSKVVDEQLMEAAYS